MYRYGGKLSKLSFGTSLIINHSRSITQKLTTRVRAHFEMYLMTTKLGVDLPTSLGMKTSIIVYPFVMNLLSRCYESRKRQRARCNTGIGGHCFVPHFSALNSESRRRHFQPFAVGRQPSVYSSMHSTACCLCPDLVKLLGQK